MTQYFPDSQTKTQNVHEVLRHLPAMRKTCVLSRDIILMPATSYDVYEYDVTFIFSSLF